MHKHRRGKPGAKQRLNANVRLPESAVSAILGLVEALGDEDDTALTYLKSEYLSKYCDESLVPADVRRSAAIAKWMKQEESNRARNAWLRGVDPGYNILPRVPFSSFLRFARRLTAQILGPLRDDVVLGSFSGGASTSKRRTESSPARKFTDLADVTEAAVPLIGVIHQQSELLRRENLFSFHREVKGAILFTVPKKTDIDRCACKEPDVNMYLQKGVGRVIRRRLLKVGINLNDQSINRRLAQVGSLNGDLATLDLSSASDSISIEVVRLLLPDEWFLYLNDIRSHEVLVDGTYYRTEMFSSMGNGFTFELESLLFYVLVRTVSYFRGSRSIISVYGDDIICSSELYDDVCFVFSRFGFQVNADKSFATGPFRESCGGHYHMGVDITPFYLKRRPTHLTDAIRVCNQLRRWAFADGARSYVLPATYKVWRNLADVVPRDLWGGCDTALDTQLVSSGPPNNRLVRLSESKKEPEIGRYLLWHNTNWKRNDPSDEEAMVPVEMTKTCRKRRARIGATNDRSEFYEELC